MFFQSSVDRYSEGMRFALSLLFTAMLLAAQTPSTSPETLFQEAVAAQKRGDDAAAIRNYQALEKLQPAVMEVHANLGVVLAHAGRYADAIHEYQVALKLNPASEPVKFNLGLAFYKQSDWVDAARQLTPLHEAHPDDVRLATLLADCDVRTGQNGEAIALLRNLESAHLEDLEIQRVLGTAYLHAGKLPDASKRLHKYAEGSQSAEAFLLAGQTALRLNEFERAKNDVAAAEATNPNLPGLATLKGQALSYLLDEKGAISALQQAVKANPDDFQAQVTLGSLLNSQRDPEAEAHLKHALELKPDSSLARYELGRAQQTNGDLPGAENNLKQVVQAEPNWLPPHVALAAVYARLKKLPEAQGEREIVDRLTAEEQKQERSNATSGTPSQ